MTAATGSLAGLSVLGLPACSTDDLIQLIKQGFTVGHVDTLAGRIHPQSRKDFLDAVGISERALAYRRRNGRRLDADQSARLLRLAQVVAAASETSADENGYRWMAGRWPALAMNTPVAYASTEVGAQAVLDLIGSVGDGIFP